MEQGWKKYLFYFSIALFVAGFIYILLETIKAKNTGFETKTLWDWMDLLIIPAVLAGGAILLNRSESALERKTAEDRAKLERDLAIDRQQEAALQIYFDRMSELLLKEKLRTTKKAEVRDVARTRTLSIMRVMNTRRNNLIIQFLREAKIITDKNSILNNAAMKEINLQNLNLKDVYLQGADLQRANLQGAILDNANLQDAILIGAKMKEARLFRADLQKAIFLEADMQGVDLQRANLESAEFYDADLRGAYLTMSNLQKAIFEGANLQDADLLGVNLQDANLVGVKNLTEKQLANVESLKGAIMPDGTDHK